MRPSFLSASLAAAALAFGAAQAEEICRSDPLEAFAATMAMHVELSEQAVDAKSLSGRAQERAEWCFSGCDAAFAEAALSYVSARKDSALMLYARDEEHFCAFLFGRDGAMRYDRVAVSPADFDRDVELVRGGVIGALGRDRAAPRQRRLEALRSGVCEPGLIDAQSGDRGFAAIVAEAEASGDSPARRIADSLFPPAIREGLDGVRHLSIVPVGPITTLPIAALRPFGDTRRAVDLFTVNYLLFAGEAARAPSRWSGRPRQPLVMGNPQPADATRAQCVTPLPGAEKEAEFVSGALSGGTLLLREAATTDGFWQHARGADMIYLAAHGLAELESGVDDSFIALADRNLTARDLQELSGFDLGAPLVVMSACQTGLGRVDRFGVIGLARTFLDIGAEATVMSLWNVSDEATYELMRVFTAELSSHAPAEALRRAQQHLRRATPFKDPVYWAAFAVYGNQMLGPSD